MRFYSNMPGSLLKWRLCVFGCFFLISTLVIYRVLMHSASVFGTWDAEDFPGQPHPRWDDFGNLKSPKAKALGNNRAHLNKPKDDDELQFQHDLGDGSVLGSNRFSGAHGKREKCNITLTILIPNISPFKAWREYRMFLEDFIRRSRPSSRDTGLRRLHVECPNHRCDVDIQVTMEEEHLRRADAIVVNMFPNALKNQLLHLLSRLRKVLNPHVHWFFYGVESPQMMAFWDPNISKIKYHHSITYHSQADIRLPYGVYLTDRPQEVMTKNAAKGLLASKTGAVIAWMASNCNNTFWPRNKFVHELAKHIPVDIYGKCGHLSCLPALSANCTKLMASYKFYLALENAECDEYITEKVWSNALRPGVVPIVYGGRKEAYEQILPPKSFIHVSDFDSVQSLASHLHTLSRDETMYNTYHAWRRQGRVASLYPPLDSRLFCETVPFVLKWPPPFRMMGDSGYYRSCKNLAGKFTNTWSTNKTFVPWGRTSFK